MGLQSRFLVKLQLGGTPGGCSVPPVAVLTLSKDMAPFLFIVLLILDTDALLDFTTLLATLLNDLIW